MLNIDEQYDAAAAGFIRRAHATATSFFFYFCSHHTHVPQFAGRGMDGYSPRGLMGDSLSMLDRSVGRLMNLTAELTIDESTLMIFSADVSTSYSRRRPSDLPLN
jgi:arylsulfatase A-like enzyme